MQSGLLPRPISSIKVDGSVPFTGRITAPALTLTQAAATSGTPTAGLIFTGGAHTDLANAETTDILIGLNRTVNFLGGGATIAQQRIVRVRFPTYTADAAQTITRATTFSVDGPPVASTNVTITEAVALQVGGLTLLGDTRPLLTESNDLGSTSLRWRVSYLSRINAAPAASTSGTPAAILTVTGPAHTGLAIAEATDLDLTGLARTVTFGSGGGTLADQRMANIGAPTYAASAALTITRATSLYIAGAPAAGSNVTITDSYPLWIDAGSPRIDSAVAIGGAVAAVLGTVGGGAGPQTALQNEWLEVYTQNGKRWIPCWA